MATLSVLVPGIRPHNWLALYNSLMYSTSASFEIIFVGPYPPPNELTNCDNVLFIKDYGPPIRAQQIALMHSTGEYLIYVADDGVLLPGEVDLTLSMISNRKDIVVWKYTESDNPKPWMFTDEYYYIKNANLNVKYIPGEWYSMLAATLNRDYVMELGGWDCRFYSPPMSHMDFGVRAQRDGANCKITNNIVAKASHMPEETGDHAPIHRISATDQELFKFIYNDPLSENRIAIPLDNWKSCSSVWNMRFSGIEKYEYDVSICVPSIRQDLLVQFYDSLVKAVGKYNFEVIFVSPHDKLKYFEPMENVQWIKSFASPTKCLQIGASEAKGRLFTWAADDGLFVKDSLSKAIAFYDMNCGDKDAVSMRYMEDVTSVSTKEFPLDYWRPQFHSESLQAPGTYIYEYMALIGLMQLSYFKHLGGVDCIYEHVNLCCIDLSCRIYNNGGKIFLSPTTVLTCSWEDGNAGTHAPVNQAYYENDIKVFREMYARPITRTCIDFDHYQKYPDVWSRRFN